MVDRFDKRLAIVEQAIRQKAAQCNCGGSGVRTFFERLHETPEEKAAREAQMRTAPPRCPLHGRVLTVFFPDPTKRPSGYARNKLQGSPFTQIS